eukprot:TRINITY_DN103094_c0_g1_i1.p1 TRINITY_DN103094_c0_g1~~TRINITY_DN103094_c0_g1_i1.p1  ORF type:complete len:484 (-),score=63.27 TRINITY_DN103094_c0_g1_i1:198-1649(-)
MSCPCLLVRSTYLLSILLSAFCSVATAAPKRPNIQWTKGYSLGTSLESHPHAGVETSDGGFLIVGDGQDYAEKNPDLKRHVLVAKVDSKGELQWQLNLGDRGYNYGKFGIELPDGSFVISGATTVKDPEYGDLLHRALVRVDKKGEVMHTLVLDSTNKQEHRMDSFTGMSLGHDPEHAFVVTGVVGAGNESTTFPDQVMFLPTGGQPCISQIAYDNAGLKVVFDRKLEELPGCEKPDCLMLEGMRVVYDPEEQQYIVAANLYYPQRYANEMGAIALGTDGEVHWMRSFPASSITGVMSQPYALAYAPSVPGASRRYVIGGHWFWTEGPQNVLRAGGRMVGFNSSGDVNFDTRWRSGERDANMECYGLQTTLDGGFIMTCGNGVEGELHPKDSDVMKTWMVFVARTDRNGNPLWSGNFTEAEHFKKQNNAGEYIIATRDGRYAVLVDSQTWGSSSTGGNFALMMLGQDTGSDGEPVAKSDEIWV